MSMPKLIKSTTVIATLVLFSAVSSQEQLVKLGTPISEDQLSSFDLIAGPDGSGFPAGKGTAKEGKLVFDTKCAACHALNGEGNSGNTRLVGGNMNSESSPMRTVGSYWPYASTVFDFIRRAMPADAPKSLTPDEVYQATAYVLFLNGIVDENTVLNKNTLMDIEMPNKDGFVDQSHIQ